MIAAEMLTASASQIVDQPLLLKRLSDWSPSQLFLELPDLLPAPTRSFLKLEGFNAAGSIKLTTARGLLDQAEDDGLIRRGATVIESSSGNLGVALSLLCVERGYRFICVVDPNASSSHLKTMKALGAELEMVTRRDVNGGYLQSRVDYIARRREADPSLFWPNQYANTANKEAHFRYTARAIARSFRHVDWLFVGCGTSGTLMGCSEYFARHSPDTVVVGVDSVGSVTFDGIGGPRHLPGVGASRRPELFVSEAVHRMVKVHETAAVAVCRSAASRWGLLAGPSTGTVIAGITACQQEIQSGAVVVAIAPDMGERYLDMLYDDEWVACRFSETPSLERSAL